MGSQCLCPQTTGFICGSCVTRVADLDMEAVLQASKAGFMLTSKMVHPI